MSSRAAPAITAILVTYNSSSVVLRALAALRQPEIASVIVVDNASSDDTCAVVAREFPDVILIKNERNEGFGCANNIALAQVKTPFALLVNPDAVLAENACQALLEAAQCYPEAALLAPLLFSEDGELHRSYKRSVFARERKRDVFTPPSGDLCADFLSGAVWLLKMELMEKVGVFDPAFFLYYEDDDVCLRVRRAGYSCVLVAAARGVHLLGRSTKAFGAGLEVFRQQQMVWSRLYLEKKYHGAEKARRLARRLRRRYLLRFAGYSLMGRRRKAVRYRGRLDGVAAFGASPTTAPMPRWWPSTSQSNG